MVDFGLDEYEERQQPREAGGDREMVPEGEHTFRLKQISELDDGRVDLWLEHPDKRYGYVFAKPPRDGWGARVLSSLRVACGMTREQWMAISVTELVGRVVRARIYHKRSGDRTFVNVGEFLLAESAEPAEPAKPVNRTPTKKADAASAMPGDDIPF